MIERAPIREPEELILPITDPIFYGEARFGFKPKTREWWMRVGNWECQYEFYDDRRGWKSCNKRAKHVHHIDPEGQHLARGEDPERAVGMPLCQEHHVRNFGTEEHSYDFSFHPDIASAYSGYGFWKDQKQRFGKRAAGPSPFQEVAREHKRKMKRGERYHAGTDEIDQYYIRKMRDMAIRYLAQNPDDPKPRTKEHPRTDRKKRWYNKI